MTLDEYLRKNKVNQCKMAKAVGCHRNHLHYLRNGKATPKLVLALAIEKYTEGQVSVEELVIHGPQSS